MYTLIGSATSPYVRKLRLYFAKNRLNYEFKSINYLEANDSAYLKTINPINKIPVLVVDNKPIFDSRVIFKFINDQHSLPHLTIEEENILSAIDGAMDTSINLITLQRGGLDLKTCNNTYIARQLERVPLILNYLRPWVKTLSSEKESDWNFLSMSLYSYLYWGQMRKVIDIENDEVMQNFLKQFSTKPFIQESSFTL